jgi:autotransporter-associated beta strand protein
MDISGSSDINKYGLGIASFDVNSGQKSFTGNVNIYNGYISTGDSNIFKGQINIYNGIGGLCAYGGTGGTIFGNTINVYGEGFYLGLDATADGDTNLSGQVNLYKQNNSIYFGAGGIRTISGQINEITASTNIEAFGSLVLSGISKNTGYFRFSGPSLNIGINSLASSSLWWDTTGTFVAATNSILGGLIGGSDLTASVAFSVGNANKNETFAGSMQGVGAVTKIGTGEWFNNNGSFSARTGATTVSNGAFRVGYDDTLGQTATGGVTINNSGSIKFIGGAPVGKAWSIGGTPFYYTAKSGSYGYGNPHVVFDTATTISSSITLTSDTVIDIGLNPIIFTGSSTISSAGYSLYFDNNTTSSNSYSVNISKPISLGSGSLGVNRSGVVPTIYLSGSQTIAGYVFNDGGYLTVNHASSLSSSNFSQRGGELNFDGNTTATIGGIYSCSANIYTINTNAAPVTVTIGTTNLSDGNYYGNIYGGGSLTKRGPESLILRNSNTYTGTTTVSTGTLGLAAITSIASSSQITVAASGNLQAQPIAAGGNVILPCSVLFNGGTFSVA